MNKIVHSSGCMGCIQPLDRVCVGSFQYDNHNYLFVNNICQRYGTYMLVYNIFLCELSQLRSSEKTELNEMTGTVLLMRWSSD